MLGRGAIAFTLVLNAVHMPDHSHAWSEKRKDKSRDNLLEARHCAIESLNIVLTATMTDFLLQDADTSGVRGCLHWESMSQILAMVLAAGAMGVTAVLTVEVKVKTPARAVEGITELK